MTGGELNFESLATQYYEPLYRFAYSLTHSEADACDLTQETFRIWATKGHQLREWAKAKAWLFTTLYRLYLEARRRETRFPNEPIEALDVEPPLISPDAINGADAEVVLQALDRVDELFRAPVALFYLEDYSYHEIADILGVPLGTVKSRIARGISQLQKHLADDLAATQRKGGKPS
jgi:RNA polymerase sigma-70 factor (ECF subfamily)